MKSQNNILRSKKSQIHIEMIMSFILFIGFITAIFIFFNPIKVQKTSTVSLDNLQAKILANVSFGYAYLPLVIKEGVSTGSCFFVESPIPVSQNIFAADGNGNIVNSKFELGKIYLQTSSGQRFYKIYFSNIFNVHSFDAPGCSALDKADYSFGSLNTESAVLFENLQKLGENYKSNYPALKNFLGLTGDFDFTVYDFSKTTLITGSSQGKTVSGKVIAREFVLNAVDRDNNKKEAMLNLRVW